MRIRTIISLASVCGAMLLLSSCTVGQLPPGLGGGADYAQAPQSPSVAQRFEESSPQGPTAVESAIELSKKYARLSEQAAELKQNNQDLTAENSKLKEQVVSLDAQLQQAQKELNEANVLLREMLVELNNWKMNVIGFRDEMRDAEKAQLEALLRILEVLGGQVTMESVGGGQEASVQGAGPSGNEIAGLSSVAAPGPVGPQLPEGAGAGEHDE